MARSPRRTAVAILAAVASLGLGVVATPAASAASAPAPQLLSPHNETNTVHKALILQWRSVPGAVRYQVQISPNRDWTNNAVQLPGKGLTVNTRFEVPISLPHASYFWRVRAVLSSGAGAWSEVWQFLRDWADPMTLLKAPTSADPTISWTPVKWASLYLVRFSTDPTFTASKTQACWTHQPEFTPYDLESTKEVAQGGCFGEGALVDGTDYYWEVVAYDGSQAPEMDVENRPDTSFECAQVQPECDGTRLTGKFTFAAARLGTDFDRNQPPTNLRASWHAAAATHTDCTATVCPVTPTLSWDPVRGANYYRVAVYRDPFATNVYRVYHTARTSLTPRDSYFDAQPGPSGQLGQAYYWVVVPATCANSDTDPTCASSTGTAATANACPPPTPPTTTGTDGGSTSTTSKPSISDVSSSPAGPAGTKSIQGGSTVTVTLTGTGFLNGACVLPNPNVGVVSNVTVPSPNTVTFTYKAPRDEHTLTFTVTNPDGGKSNDSPDVQVAGVARLQFGTASSIVTFKKQSGPVTLLSPANRGRLNRANATFRWTDFFSTGARGSYDAMNYRLQVARDSDFDNIVWDFANIDLTEYTNPARFLPDGSYFWRVAPIDESGNLLTWSAAQSFTSDATPPRLGLADRNGMKIGRPLTVVASEPIRGFSSRAVHIVADSTGGALSGTWRQGDNARTWIFSPAKPLVTGERYAVSVSPSVTDLSGNSAVSGRTVRTSTLADSGGRAWHYSSGWSKHRASGAVNKSFMAASSGASASMAFTGNHVTLYGCKGPSYGTVAVSLDGRTVIRLSQHQSFTRCGVALWSVPVVQDRHTLKVTVFAGRGNLDAVTVG